MSPEVQAAVASGAFLLMATLVTVLLPKLWRQSRDIREVKDQVQNSHGTNLRDDIDAFRYEVRAGFGQVHQRLNVMHLDIATERQERLRLAERLENQK